MQDRGDEGILELLVADKKLTTKDADGVRLEQKETGTPLKNILLLQGLVSEEDLLRARSNIIKIPFQSMDEISPEPTVVMNIPEIFALERAVIAISKDKGVMKVVMESPTDVLVQDEIRRMVKCEVKPMLGARGAIIKKLSEYHDHYKAHMVDRLLKSVSDQGAGLTKQLGLEIRNLDDVAEQDTVIKTVNLCLLQGLMRRASDIHLVPSRRKVKVFYRIDGRLQEAQELDRAMHQAIVNRIKIIADMDISEKRMPQDSSFHITIEGREIDFRVASTPTTHGEKIIMRILDKGAIVLGLEHLGFSGDNLAELRRHISRPHGIILIAGPTGCGKTTTLYSALHSINSTEKNITTVEDPVEYDIDGITQIQAHADIGLTFSAVLRSILRQDPDVILIGEIRDVETAEIAIRASLTGHLVFATVHTNEAASAVTRLVDMGIEPFLIASSLRCTLSQRLVRMVCHNCAQEYAVDEEARRRLKLSAAAAKDLKLYRGTGCRYCFSTGYQGRTVISEILTVKEKVRSMITKRAASVEIERAAIEDGMKTMYEDGLEKVLAGQVTLEELLAACEEADLE